MAKKSRKSSGGIRCTCPKVCFSESAAKMALLNAKIARALHHSQKRKEVRVYGDCLCGHWHLTSKEDKSGKGEGLSETGVQGGIVDG